MHGTVSTISYLASVLYLLVATTCLHAGWTADKFRQAPSQRHIWLLVAGLFVLLMLARLFAVEESIRDSLRSAMRASGNYSERRELQAPIISGLLVIGTGAGAFLVYRWGRMLRGRRNYMVFVSVLAAFAMVSLIALRLTSLHLVDALLYGALKLNWVIDVGSSLAIMAAAINYVRLVRARP